MSEHARPVLDYMGNPAQKRAHINGAAMLSIACGVSAMLFLVGVCIGAWRTFAPSLALHMGWIEMTLGAIAVVSGAIGALQAPRDSKWYGISLIGYASGIFIWTLCPVFFLL